MFFSKKIKKDLKEFDDDFKKTTEKNRQYTNPNFKKFDETFKSKNSEFKEFKKYVKSNLDTK